MVKKTVAILGDTGEFSSEVMEAFLKQDLRLLFVSEDETRFLKLKTKLETLPAVAEIDSISCQREGCWEADIIVIARKENFSSDFNAKIKEVATQKIVLIVSEEIDQSGQPELEIMLPYSKIVEIAFDTQQNGFSVSGRDVESQLAVQRIFGNKF